MREYRATPEAAPILAASILFACGLLCGCAGSVPEEPYYNLSVQNSGDLDISDILLSFGEYEWQVGDLASGVTKTEVGCTEPVPASLSLQWRSADGRSHEEQIAIAEPLPQDFEGRIELKVDNRNTVVLDVFRKY